MKPLIVNVALTGCVAGKADNPHLPITPEEVAADARRCAGAGATMFHVHARADGQPAWGKYRYLPYVEAIREAAPGAVVVVSCSGRHFRQIEQRKAAIESGADMASLTMGSVDFPDGTTGENGRDTVRKLLAEMRQWRVRPECEVFDLGHVFCLRELARAGEIVPPIWVNMILGVHVPADLQFHWLLGWLPPGCLWAATALGREAWPVNRRAILLGMHVRVGLEDSLWMGQGDRASNPRLVERAVEYGQSVDREPATLEQTREMLGL